MIFQCFSSNSTFATVGIDDLDIVNETKALINLTNSTEIENDLSSMLDITNSTTLINSTLEDNMAPYELEIASFVLFLLSSIIGCYLMFNMRRYLKTKAPGTKTILDEFYVILFTYWIVEDLLWEIIFFQANVLKDLEVPWLWSVLLVNAGILILLLSHIHLLVSLLVNIILIYAPQVSEELDETFVIRLTM